ncbi:tetratricopeptide repeat protein [Microbulbifer sp. Q7]|uniref:tetratricopeptide repeat protein n=1 Tax=Microbulbifer sp. Q7 TaxID=1785091 RepID=UPI00083763A1|nr:tetratricopeptide repeat protein [Microbulbifer sp. Q7]
MGDACQYHSNADAAWQCTGCSTNYCGTCVPGSALNYHQSTPKCTLCNKRLENVGASNAAKPFWQMAPFYFRYGCTAGPLTVSSLCAVAALAMTGLGLLSIFVFVATLAVVMRYNLLVIEKLAGGQLEAPTFGDAQDGRSAAIFAKVIGMILVAGGAGVLLAGLGEGAVQVYSIALSLLAPAAMIVLALEHSMRAAVNPLKLLQFTLIIGWPYWLLWLSTSAVSAAPAYLLPLVAEKLPAWMLLPLLAFITSYFSIVTSAMMGYICLTRQRKLGVIAQVEDQEPLEEREFERLKALADTVILLREGRHDEARKTLVNVLRQQPNDIALNERYIRLLLATDDKKALRELGPHLLERLVNLNHPHKAAELYLAIAASHGVPAIDKSLLRHQIAEALYHQRHFKPALALINNLHKEDPHYTRLDSAYLLLAKIYLDGFNRTDNCRKLLAFVQKKFPNSSVLGEVRKLDAILAAEQNAQPA